MKKNYLKSLFLMMSFLVVLPMMAQTQLQKEQITSPSAGKINVLYIYTSYF